MRHFGCILDHRHFESCDKLLGELPHPLFGAAAYKLDGSGDNKLSLPVLSYIEYAGHDIFAKDPQTTGDCVSHGSKSAASISSSVEVHIKKEPERWVPLATEAIYGARGHSGQGMDPARASRFVNEFGLVARGKYGQIDLSVYDASYGIKWGRRGVPPSIKKVASEHPVRTVSLITSVEEARDALGNGYGLHIGSGVGFVSKRDSEGFCRESRGWNHDMCVAGCQFERDRRPGFLLANSWGTWVSGGHPNGYKIPPGCFLADVEVFAKMLRSRGCWAFSNVDGFPAQTLPDYGFGDWI